MGARYVADGGVKDVEAMKGVEEKEGAHAFVEIVARAAEAVERRAFEQQVVQSRRPLRGLTWDQVVLTYGCAVG